MKFKKMFNLNQLLKLIIPSICLAISIIVLVADTKPMVLIIFLMIPFMFVTGGAWRIVKDIESGRIELKMAAGLSKTTYFLNFLGLKTIFNMLSTFVVLLAWGIIHSQYDQAIYMYLLVIALFMLSIGLTLRIGLFTRSSGSTISFAVTSAIACYWIVVGLHDHHVTEKGIWFLIAMVFAIIALSLILIIWAFRSKWARWNERTIQEDSSPAPTQVVSQKVLEKVQGFLEKLE